MTLQVTLQVTHHDTHQVIYHVAKSLDVIKGETEVVEMMKSFCNFWGTFGEHLGNIRVKNS